MNSKNTNTNVARVAGQIEAVKVQLGEAARKSVKENHTAAPIIETAKRLAAKAGRKSVTLTDLAKATAALIPPPAKPAKKAKSIEVGEKRNSKIDKGEAPELNWAYRRLRRQALLFFGQTLKSEGHLSNLKALREDLESVPESYAALKAKCEALVENDNKIHGTWESFMEFFFGHVIHPGARGPLDR